MRGSFQIERLGKTARTIVPPPPPSPSTCSAQAGNPRGDRRLHLVERAVYQQQPEGNYSFLSEKSHQYVRDQPLAMIHNRSILVCILVIRRAPKARRAKSPRAAAHGVVKVCMYVLCMYVRSTLCNMYMSVANSLLGAGDSSVFRR